MSLLFSALSALAYGSADFLGGVGTRRNPAYAVLIWSQLIGLLVALFFALFVGNAFEGSGESGTWPAVDLAWGAAAGLAGAAGIIFLYHALAHTVASIASPIAAVVGASIPIVAGVLFGERPEPIVWIGVALAFPAILLLSADRTQTIKIGSAVRLGLLAGGGFGLFFLFISRTGEESGLWPLVSARVASVSVVASAALLSKRSIGLARGRMRVSVVGAGVLDMLANLFFLVASRSGLLVVATIVTSLYPAPTVIFARVFFHERLSSTRIAGLLLAVAGVALIGIG